MSLCFGDAFRKKQYGEITKQDYIKYLMAHFRGLRHPTDHPDCVDEMIFIWNNDVFGDTIRDIALKTEYTALSDTSILEKHFCSCLNDDLETFTSTLKEIQKQHPSLNLIQPSTALAAYEQQPLIFKYCLSHGASLDHSVEKAIRTPINPSLVPIRLTQPREWSIPFLNALYEVDWDRIQSSRKALGHWLQPSFSPEVRAWFFDHGAEIEDDFFTHMSHFPIPAANVQDLLERTGVSHFNYSGVLQRAAGRGETDVVKLLLDAGADINEAPFGGDERESGPSNAIFEAVKGQHIETTRLLLNRGAQTSSLHDRCYSSAPRTLAGRQVGEMAELLSLYRVIE